jgi:hypothetical protein
MQNLPAKMEDIIPYGVYVIHLGVDQFPGEKSEGVLEIWPRTPASY